MEHIVNIENKIEEAKKEKKEMVLLPIKEVESLLYAYKRYQKFYNLAEESLSDRDYDAITDEWVHWEEENK